MNSVVDATHTSHGYKQAAAVKIAGCDAITLSPDETNSSLGGKAVSNKVKEGSLLPSILVILSGAVTWRAWTFAGF